MALLLIQMAVVLATALFCGWIATKIGQAKVIGEIVGGILLGPSVLGRVAPLASARLFPQSSFAPLEILSTVGLVLFMFLIGSELDYEHLKQQRRITVVASSASILVPLILAAGLAPALYARFAPTATSKAAFTLFLCIAMSITAFPVLVRILEERRLQSTSLGTRALICAAVNDVFAWILLPIALVLTPHGNEPMTIAQRLLWLCAYLFAMLCVIRPIGHWLVLRATVFERSYEFLAVVAIFVFASAAATDALGVHPLFGAFMAGVCFPRIEHPPAAVRERLHAVVSVLLLPLFFALTGMRTRFDLLNSYEAWIWTAVVLVAAIAGKMGGTTLAARLAGQPWRDAAALGALLNTRGLVELIVLNIAYSAHVFSQTLFTMLAAMAVITTMMTSPILSLLGVGEAGDVSGEAVLAGAGHGVPASSAWPGMRSPQLARTGLRRPLIFWRSR